MTDDAEGAAAAMHAEASATETIQTARNRFAQREAQTQGLLGKVRSQERKASS